MAPGALALVLHAHLPYVRAEKEHSLEEDWFFQALIECYLPLLETLEAAAADPQLAPELTMGVSPTLLLTMRRGPALNGPLVSEGWVCVVSGTMPTRLSWLASSPRFRCNVRFGHRFQQQRSWPNLQPRQLFRRWPLGFRGLSSL